MVPRLVSSYSNRRLTVCPVMLLRAFALNRSIILSSISVAYCACMLVFIGMHVESENFRYFLYVTGDFGGERLKEIKNSNLIM